MKQDMTTVAPDTRLTRDELHFIVALAADCSLDESPGTNWVQEAGGLPDYICQIARAVKRDGKLTSAAIAIAVNRCKVWATGKGVTAKTQAKAAKAVAEWEKLRAKSRVKTAAKALGTKAEHALAATGTATDVIVLAAGDYPLDVVREAFNARIRAARTAWRTANPSQSIYDADDAPGNLWVKEQWNTFLIVQSDYGNDPDLYKIPYTVDTSGEEPEVSFGTPVQVVSQYVEVTDLDPDVSAMSDAALEKLVEASGPCPKATGAARLVQLSARREPAGLDKILGLAATKDAAASATFADPGYQSDGKPRYALNNAGQARAAWSAINQKAAATTYSAEDLATIKARIMAACKRLGVNLGKAAMGKGAMGEG